ncbi:hypothetical protein BGX34_007298, partial [Mortierella sp. NVP85]
AQTTYELWTDVEVETLKPSVEKCHVEDAHAALVAHRQALQKMLYRAFLLLGGLPQARPVKGESGSGKPCLVNALCKQYSVQYTSTATITIGDLAMMSGDLLKGLKYLASIKPHASAARTSYCALTFDSQ